MKTAYHIVIVSSPYGSPIILVLRVSNTGGVKCDFRSILQTIQDSAIVTIEGEYETAPELSNGAIFNDFE